MLLAQEPISNPIGPKVSSGISFFQQLVPNLVGLGFVIGSLVFVFIIIVGAIQWMTSGGDKAAIEAARGKIANAFVGLLILFALFAILGAIQTFFHLDILKLNIQPLILGQ